MTIIETIHATDSLLPNSYDSLTKAGWVLEADGMVRAEIHGEKADLTAQGKDACETDRTLAVPYPFDMIYRHYLLAMICHANGDYTQYNNHIINYNTAFLAYESYYNRSVRQKAQRFLF